MWWVIDPQTPQGSSCPGSKGEPDATLFVGDLCVTVSHKFLVAVPNTGPPSNPYICQSGARVWLAGYFFT